MTLFPKSPRGLAGAASGPSCGLLYSGSELAGASATAHVRTQPWSDPFVTWLSTWRWGRQSLKKSDQGSHLHTREAQVVTVEVEPVRGTEAHAFDGSVLVRSVIG